MIIYKLEINDVVQDNKPGVPDDQIKQLVFKSQEFYAQQAAADARKADILTNLQNLIGFVPQIEITISEVSVIE